MLKCLFYHYPVRAWFPVYVYDESRKDMTQMSGSLDISKIITLYHNIYTCYMILSISRSVHDITFCTRAIWSLSISRSVHVLYDPDRYHVLYTISRSVHVIYDPYRYHIHNINFERFIMINTFMLYNPLYLIIRCFFLSQLLGSTSLSYQTFKRI
jgi:hypothetical protein